MKRMTRKVVAVLLAVALVIPCVKMTAWAADYNHKLSVDTKVNANPGASHFSMEYFDTSDYSFKKMDKFVEAGGSSYWTISDSTNVAIKGWTQSASNSKYTVVRYTTTDTGTVTLQKETNARTGVFTNADGEFMIVQKSLEGYSPIWPIKGSWEWESIAKDSATSFCSTGLKAYVNTGDELLFIIRSTNKSAVVNANINYWVALTKTVTDVDSLRPITWDSYFKGADDKLTTTGPAVSSPYVKNESNLDTKVYTQEYIDSTEGFQKLDTYNSSSQYWTLRTEANLRIGPYYMMATSNEYSAMVYHATVDGYANLTNAYQLFTSKNASYDLAEAIVVLSNSNGYYPVWPAEGSWEWKTIPKGSATDGIELNLTTYMKAGDELALVVRSSNTGKGITWMQTDCRTYFTTIKSDYRELYPTTWSATFPYGDSSDKNNKFTGMTLSLDGKIGFNFYVDSNNTLSNDAYVEFVLPKDGTQVVTKANAIETSNGLKFTCLVPAKEMADVIAVTLYDDGKVLDTKSISVRDYAEIIIKNETNNEAYAKATPLIKAMLHYGAYAQKLFEYNTGDLADKNYVSDDAVQNVESAQLAGFAKEKQGKEGFGSLAGATLILEGETTLRMFFTFEEDVSLEGLKFTVNGIEQIYKTSDNYYIVEFTNIAADDLDKDYTVVVTAGDNTFCATSSAMTFCYNALLNSDNMALQNVAKALYLYNAEAKTYFN